MQNCVCNCKLVFSFVKTIIINKMEKVQLNYVSDRVSINDKDWKFIRGNWFHKDTQGFKTWMKTSKKIMVSRVTISNCVNRNLGSMYMWTCLKEYVEQKK